MNIKALVVDRKSVERCELTQPLEQAGLRTVDYANVQELAAQPFRPGQYDVVFIDFHTLMEAGRTLIRSLREMDADVPLVVTYPHTAQLADLKTYCPQASAYLESPFSRDELHDALEACVSAATV
jgi:DNA-binding NtrC family response regulator